MVRTVQTSMLKRVEVEPLTVEAFRPFGSVIANPEGRNGSHDQARSASSSSAAAGVSPASSAGTLFPSPVPANQGTALKYPDVSDITHFYAQAPSRTAARPSLSLFVCSPRELKADTTPDSSSSESAVLPIRFLERHPFTPQTFIPMGLDPKGSKTKYLVIVAPTLPMTRTQEARPPPFPQRPPRRRRSLKDIFSRARPPPFPGTAGEPPSSRSGSGRKRPLPGPGLPDLEKIRAFIANGSQAVTYGAGTWHAPMIVLGETAMTFTVVQFVNGIETEDCQEIEITSRGLEAEVVAVIPRREPLCDIKSVKLGTLKAKL